MITLLSRCPPLVFAGGLSRHTAAASSDQHWRPTGLTQIQGRGVQGATYLYYTNSYNPHFEIELFLRSTLMSSSV